ncbi:hypothetical protein HQ865_24960 [Mucilaginibacter mali]|uniref:Uncharacterized protein n=1 Tax=Mucilaginibacter mali TaxID=2740462 RepID=A0A7D4Q7B8_9SPHI|nr:hypothetical protein [Mucilaginibacter mali]QKJ32867.1 hypothetical protein HQ865_24960 [Mucilaginibacter mali]
MNSPDNDIKKLIPWGGGWAARFYFDYYISHQLQNRSYNLPLASLISKNSSGMAAVKYFDKINKITGATQIQYISSEIKNCRSVVDLSNLTNQANELLTSAYWLSRLKDHTNSNTPLKIIKAKLQKEQLAPSGSPLRFLELWSFPLLCELFPFQKPVVNVRYIETELSGQAWKKWFVSDSGVPIWIDNKTKSNFRQSQYLVWKLLHEATHLLHLANYPFAGSLHDPYYALQLESVAMAAEFRLLQYLESNKELSNKHIFPLNRNNIISVLLLGFFERALRLEADVQLHYHRQSPNDWLADGGRQYDSELFHFVNEFHGLPGFMAGYLIGMFKYLNAGDEKNILTNKTQLFYENN